MRIIRPFLVIFYTCSFLVLTSFIHYDNPLINVKNYTIYYDEVNQEILEKLTKFDLVIIEPHAFTKDQIQTLRQQGTIVIGYMSLMELEKWNEDFVQKVIDEDYYLRNNEKIYIAEWDTYIMNISKDHYRGLLIDEIKEEIVDKELDGVFFDTIGDIDDYFSADPVEMKKLRKGYVQILEHIKHNNPELLLVQNWGFETFKSVSNPYLDGILWEDFKKSRLTKSSWAQKWINYFKMVEKQKRVAVLTVTPSDSDKKYSLKHGFTSAINKDSYYNELK